MWAGITFDGLHSFRDFGATMNSRKASFPPKDRVTERVPYSSVTEDFTALCGSASYAERTLVYKFIISDIRGGDYLKQRVDRFVRWLYEPVVKQRLYDDRETEYYYLAVCTQVADPVYIGGVVAEIGVTFMADPYKYPAVDPSAGAIPVSDARYPDLDADGHVGSAEASMILSAVANIGMGLPSGLTAEQEYLADCDRDGSISAADASLVLLFAGECGLGIREDTPAGWCAFLNYHFGRPTEVI